MFTTVTVCLGCHRTYAKTSSTKHLGAVHAASRMTIEVLSERAYEYRWGLELELTRDLEHLF